MYASTAIKKAAVECMVLYVDALAVYSLSRGRQTNAMHPALIADTSEWHAWGNLQSALCHHSASLGGGGKVRRPCMHVHTLDAACLP